MMQFLINEVPDGAEYCRRSDFLHAFPLGDDQFDMDRLLNGVQVVDTRLTESDLETIDQSEPRPEYARFFEIVDRQDSKKRGEALCSITIFKLNQEIGTTGKTFDVYLNGLKAKIHYFRHESPNQKLRVYAGYNTWDILHGEGILEADDVDFVRMKDSSAWTEIGTFWRFLAFDDYDYPFVYISETDGHGKFVDGKWTVDKKGHWGCNLEFLEAGVAGDMHMATKILPTPAPETREGSIPEAFPLFFWVEDYRLSDSLFMHRLSEYTQSATPEMLRGPKRLPFSSIAKILCHHFARGDERIIYHPESNLWTNIRERHPNLNFRYIDDHWLFHLTKILRVKYVIHTDEFIELNYQFERYGENWFVKRLFDDLVGNDNLFVLKNAEDKGDLFSLSYSERQDHINESKDMKEWLFFVDKFLNYSNYCSPSKFYHKLSDSALLPNEIQMMDTRFTEKDLERINDAVSFDSPFNRIFNIKDRQDSKKRGEALCSTNIWQSRDGWAMQPFSDYLDGLKNRIHHYRKVQPEQKLRVYVGNNTWDILHKEKVLEADDVDFVRMGISSESSIVGLLWRLLAFDDYEYEYVYVEDSDDRTTLLPNGKRIPVEPLLITKEVLERRMSVPGGNRTVHVASALSVGAKDKDGDFFVPLDVDVEKHNVPTPIKQIYAPHTYYETSILSLTRGSRRLPFEIVRVLCECLSRPTTHFLYHNPTDCWTLFTALMSPLQDTAMDESWAFYMSKLIDIKMWIRPESMGYVENFFKKYGENNFFQRIHEQMVIDGNILACGDQGVEDFSFERFRS